MIHATAISSILSPDYLAKFTIDHYGFDQNSSCSVLKIGINHSYLIVTPNKKFMLRVYCINWRTKNEIEEELKLIDYLKDHDLSVSFPIRDRDDNYIQRIKAAEGERFAVLFSFAEGEFIRIPSESICYNLGTTMARMHQLTVNRATKRKDYDANTLVDWAYQLARNHFSENLDEIKYFERANATIQTEFEKVDSGNLRFGAIHLDLWYENMKVKNESEITIFDFDNCGNGWLFLDISYSLMVLFRNEPDKEIFKKKRESFFKGYESITSISKEEKRLIPYGGLAIWLHYSGIHVQRFNDFSNQFLSEEFLKYWMHMINQWMEFNGVKV